ncbi:hypothetical protein [Cupriavidus basilensis]|uniref:hypothetical protein n=1 Tax=Cupriavidus basilensis TaxID=68895 RepID=UPI000695FF57|nr:hypothetical protein [Cupriavidus basilensis]
MNVLGYVIPGWARALFIVAALLAVYVLGRLDGERIQGAEHADYVAKQATTAVKVVEAQTKVVTVTETKWRDRIVTVRAKGDTIIKEVPKYVTPSDDSACTVNAGFVRSYHAAWAGEPAGPPADSDREPSGVPLSEVAEADAFNASVARQWREQALGLRDFYVNLQKAREEAAK